MRKLFALILCLILCLGLLGSFACKGEEPSATVAPTREIINPFETQRQLNSLQLRNFLGKAELNKDSAYIKSGTGSLKVTVDSEPLVDDKMPMLYQGMDQTTIGRPNFENFEEIGNVTMDVYSAQSGTTRVGLRLIYKYDPWGDSTQSNLYWFEVKNGWNTLNVKTLREYMPKNNDGVRAVDLISICFERGAEDRVYYLDNLKQIKTNNPIKNINDYRSVNEIASYDEEWQVHYTQSLAIHDFHLPEFEHNLDPRYTVDGRGGSLKVTFPEAVEIDYPSVILDDRLLSKKNFIGYKDSDLIAFDVYLQPGSTTNFIEVIMGAADGAQQFAAHTVQIQPGYWQKVSFKVGDLRANSPTPTVHFNNMRYFRICIESQKTEVVLYIDNIRMEVVN